MIGTTVSHYRILEKLGSGGMGVVYKAEDTRLRRSVALKFLPDDVARDAQALDRFVREARAASALNHPNICTIYEIGKERGRAFIAMEYLDGKTLAQVVDQGQLDFERLVEVAIQIAEGLEAAHAGGIVHRDIKLNNIFITTRGSVKILDFGLAKRTEVKPQNESGGSRPERTATGSVMGTVSYMSPEQARGKPLDNRTDLFSFGVVLYYLSSGVLPFHGETTAVVFSSLLNDNPAGLTSFKPDLPFELERIIGKCLEKDRDLRYQHACEIRADLKRLMRDSGSQPRVTANLGQPDPRSADPRPASALAVKRVPTPRWARAATAGVLVTAAGISLYLWMRAPEPPKVANYTQITHDGQPKTLAGTDGSRLYIGLGAPSSLRIAQVYVSGGEPVALPTPSAGMYPLDVSRDGSDLLAMDYPGRLWSLPILGGSARRLGDAVASGAAWSPDGKMLAYTYKSDLFMAKSDGTDPRKLISLIGRLKAPRFSPNENAVRFILSDTNTGASSLWEVSTQGTSPHPLFPGRQPLPNDDEARWTEDGRYFIFVSGQQLWAAREMTGLMRQSLDKPVQSTFSPLELTSPVPSKDGKKIFVLGRSFLGTLERYDKQSGQLFPFLSGTSAEHVAFSKDGQWIAYVTFPEGILWRSRADGSERLRLSYSPLRPFLPRWSPNGRQILFYGRAAPGQPFRLYIVSSDGGSPKQLIPGGPDSQTDPDWSPDETRVVFARNLGNADSAIQVLDLESHNVSTVPGSEGIFSPRWSPDGRYIVAMPRDTRSLALFDISKQNWSELARLPVGTAFPNWSKDGRFVYFLRFPDNLAVVRVGIADRKVERVADLKNVATIGSWGVWLGLTPDDSPLILRDAGTQDIYSLDWQAP